AHAGGDRTLCNRGRAVLLLHVVERVHRQDDGVRALWIDRDRATSVLELLHLGRVAVALRRANLPLEEHEGCLGGVGLYQLFAGGDGGLPPLGVQQKLPLGVQHGRITGVLREQRIDDRDCLVGRAGGRERVDDRRGDRRVRRVSAPDAQVVLDRLVLVALRGV